MSDFSDGLKSDLKLDKNILNRKIDFSREKFVKGISSTKFGQKEDPTYLHFKFIFDLVLSGIIDPETFLAPSPLFKKKWIKSIMNVAAYEQSQGAKASS
jgi:hypothetical protein